MISASKIILNYVCPAAGVVTAGFMFSAPYFDVRRATLEGTLGDLNPTPWAVMLGNCTGWITYSYLTHNWFLFWANLPGLLLAIWLNLQASKLRYQEFHSKKTRQSILEALVHEDDLSKSRLYDVEDQDKKLHYDDNDTEVTNPHSSIGSSSGNMKNIADQNHSNTMLDYSRIVWNVTTQKTPVPAPHENLVLVVIMIWMTLITLIAMSYSNFLSKDDKEFVIGIAVNLNLVFFYGAPLSTIYKVLRTRTCNSIHIPTMITNFFNGVFWCAYGFAVVDVFLIVPNGLGAILSGVQMVLCIVFPRIKDDCNRTNDSVENGNNVKQACAGDEAQHSTLFQDVETKHEKTKNNKGETTLLENASADNSDAATPITTDTQEQGIETTLNC